MRMARFSQVFGALALGAALMAAPTASFAGVFVGIGISADYAPPPLPVYVQPPCPVPDDIWTPGYWSYGPYGYFWVPGTWVAAPQPGYLWTPGYWGYNGGLYGWHAGYWGLHVGFYGGVNYGFGYGGIGYAGGAWFGNHFSYNTAVTNVNTTVINNTYVNKTVVNNYGAGTGATENRVSYNGGPAGIAARPTPEDAAAQNEEHLPATTVQQQHVEAASQDRSGFASENHGVPEKAAVASPLGRENHSDGIGSTNEERGVRGERGNDAQRNDAFSRFDRGSNTSTHADDAAKSESHGDAAYGSKDTYQTPATAYQHANGYRTSKGASHRATHAATEHPRDK